MRLQIHTFSVLILSLLLPLTAACHHTRTDEMMRHFTIPTQDGGVVSMGLRVDGPSEPANELHVAYLTVQRPDGSTVASKKSEMGEDQEWRRGWDSNPRYPGGTLAFEASSFNHSDTSPSDGSADNQTREQRNTVVAGQKFVKAKDAPKQAANTLPDDAVTTSPYAIRRVARLPELDAPWDDPIWRKAQTAAITHYHSRSTWHRPVILARVLHNGKHMQIMFQVHDRFVRSIHPENRGAVWEDSCVEFFVKPGPQTDYIAFEFNAGGALTASRVECPVPPQAHRRRIDQLSSAVHDAVQVHHSLPKIVDPEIEEPTTWTLSARIPLSLFEPLLGMPVDPSGQTWRGNFYKCADQTSHPHWGSWSALGEELNFHRPKFFGELRFE